MSSARPSTDTRHGLILLRGGLDDAADAATRDWDDFCDRIGWQAADALSSTAEPAEDFEERLATRLFGKKASRDAFRDSVVIAIDRDRDARIDAVTAAHFTDGDAAREGTTWRRVAFPAAAAIAVAAAVAFLLASSFSSKASPSASSIPEKDDAVLRATVLPNVDGVPSVDRSPIDPPRSPNMVPKTDDSPSVPERTNHAKPAPSDEGPKDVRAPNSGALVARASTSDGPYRVASVRSRNVEAPSAGVASVEHAASASAPSHTLVEFDESVARDDRPRTLETLTRDRNALPDAHRSDLAPASIALATGGMSNGGWIASETPQGARLANASWALEPGGERWLGVSVTPSAGPALAGGGVMAQLDLGKALGQL